MAKRVLAIGLGGTGKACLTILKERLEESYGRVPGNVVLLSLDTDSLRDVDRFAGTRLDPEFGEGGRLPEFQHIVSPGGMTMDTLFADIRTGKTAAYMNWLEHEKLDRILSPAERDIRGGAQQRRVIGRTALFLRYASPVYQSIVEGIGRTYGYSDEDQSLSFTVAEIEQNKRQVFLISSVAGGTGSGMFIDVANLVRHAISSNPSWFSISVSAVIVLPDAFAHYARSMDDPTNLKPNSYSALREFDRFMGVHSSFLPYMIRYAEGEQSITWSTNQPVDHVYLVDTASRSASQDFDLSGDPMRGVFPVIADFVMAHVDDSLGDALATLRSNAGMHYDKPTGRMYSSFNVMNYIFPVDDVIESFSYRFTRELLAREFLPVPDSMLRAQLNQEALNEVERSFIMNTVAGRANPSIIQESIIAMSSIDPNRLDMSRSGLFELISLSDGSSVEHYLFLQESLDYLQGSLVLTRDGDYKRESFDDGASRLLNFADQFLNDYLGQQADPDDPESRFGGDWDNVLGEYRDALRLQFAQALDAALLDALNRRDERKMLLPNRLPYARMLLVHLKQYLVQFKALLEDLWCEQQVETRLRQVSEEVRNAITWMNYTRFERYLPPFMTQPRQAQRSFKSQFVEQMYLLLHQRIYRAVLDVLDSLGATEKDSAGQLSVLDTAMLEMENWERTLQDVDRLIVAQERQHKANRAEKNTVKVRRYLTNPQFEDELYRRPEHLPAVATRIMGQVGDQKGLQWMRLDEEVPLNFKLFTTWGEQAKEAEEIARTWFAGAKELFQVVRDNVTVAERLTAEFRRQAPAFANRCLQVEEPLLRYNPAKNDVAPFPECYVSFNLGKAREEGARQFLQQARATLRDQGFNVDTTAESLVTCTVVEISRGIKLAAVRSHNQCEPEYRDKLNRARESLHLFPEEQYATELEYAIPTLGEVADQQRELSPELVIAMGDLAKLRAFTLGYAYRLISADTYIDPETGQESTELLLKLGDSRRLPLSQSKVMRGLNSAFAHLPASEQEALLLLNALQNFVLKITELPGFNKGLIGRVKAELQRRGVPLEGMENPLTFKLRDMNEAFNKLISEIGPSSDEISDRTQRLAVNATRRLDQLEPFVANRISRLKNSPNSSIRDLGTVMHLILREEIQTLASRAGRSARTVLIEWDTVFDLLSDGR